MVAAVALVVVVVISDVHHQARRREDCHVCLSMFLSSCLTSEHRLEIVKSVTLAEGSSGTDAAGRRMARHGDHLHHLRKLHRGVCRDTGDRSRNPLEPHTSRYSISADGVAMQGTATQRPDAAPISLSMYVHSAAIALPPFLLLQMDDTMSRRSGGKHHFGSVQWGERALSKLTVITSPTTTCRTPTMSNMATTRLGPADAV